MLLARTCLAVAVILGPLLAQTAPEALGRYRSRAILGTTQNPPSPGSLFQQNSYLADLARDARASQIGDLVTIAISEQASALTSGSLTQSRSSSSDSAITNLLGVMGPLSGLPNLFNQDSDTSLDGSGSTGRQMAVTAVVTAHVVEVMPNGNLIIEGAKEISVNAERQLVVIRGVVRQADLRTDNSVSSDRIALLDLRVNGKGVVHEAIRRPNALYRLFRRLLPF
jgi:flagellar L-ring protein precursor FlgH